MNSLVLQVSRMFRFASRDPYLPSRCNAVYYEIPPDTTCECKVWCKYPPPGTLVPIKNHLNTSSYNQISKHGTSQLHNRYEQASCKGS